MSHQRLDADKSTFRRISRSEARLRRRPGASTVCAGLPQEGDDPGLPSGGRGQRDPWALGVSPAHFAQHLQVLKTIANPISLQDLIEAKSDRELPPRPVCITFDDGYADNLYAAKPALESYRVPGTVFITTGYIGMPENLWWDELAKPILDPTSRQEDLSLSFNGFHYAYAFPPRDGEGGNPDPHSKWRAWENAPGPRQTAYLAIYGMLVKLSDGERERALEQLRRGTTPYGDRRQHRCLTEDELRELAEGELVEIGAHTLTHPVLADLAPDQHSMRSAAANDGWSTDGQED